NSQNIIDDKGYWDSGCSWHMIGNISYLSDYEPYDGGYVSFGQSGGKITSKEYIVLGRDFKLKDDTNVLLKTPRQHNMYSIDLNNIVPHKDPTCLVEKASTYESMLWHRRLGKQHKASCKTKLVNSVSKPLHTLHMDLFEHTSDETSGILRNFITEIENLKIITGLENKLIEKGAGPNWLFDIDTLTNSMNYVPVVVTGTSSTNYSAHLESSTSTAQDACNADAPESNGNSNPTVTSINPSADHMETLTVESVIPTVSLPVPTACLDDSPKPSSDIRLI
nr:hypothetical protein [Tanacetum cinerariifolium]